MPPPWCLMLFGAIFLYWAYEHYLEMIEFEEGRIDRMLMYWFMIALYDATGFWPTVILPFVAAAAIFLAGVSLQIRDLRARARGEMPALSYEPVRWQGLLTALLVVVGVIAALIGLAFLLRID
jgi:hypothetical protein